jgi:hypothetical protein
MEREIAGKVGAVSGFADPWLWNIVPKAGTHQRVRHEIYAYLCGRSC